MEKLNVRDSENAMKIAFICGQIESQKGFSFEKREAIADLCGINYRAMSDERRVVRMCIKKIMDTEDVELGLKVLSVLL